MTEHNKSQSMEGFFTKEMGTCTRCSFCLFIYETYLYFLCKTWRPNGRENQISNGPSKQTEPVPCSHSLLQITATLLTATLCGPPYAGHLRDSNLSQIMCRPIKMAVKLISQSTRYFSHLRTMLAISDPSNSQITQHTPSWSQNWGLLVLQVNRK